MSFRELVQLVLIMIAIPTPEIQAETKVYGPFLRAVALECRP
jgi:hypothetical protein